MRVSFARETVSRSCARRSGRETGRCVGAGARRSDASQSKASRGVRRSGRETERRKPKRGKPRRGANRGDASQSETSRGGARTGARVHRGKIRRSHRRCDTRRSFPQASAPAKEKGLSAESPFRQFKLRLLNLNLCAGLNELSLDSLSVFLGSAFLDCLRSSNGKVACCF